MTKLLFFPGGFHPPHPGHKEVYAHIQKTFGVDPTLVATNVTKNRPFSFEQKQQLASYLGIPSKNFVQVEKPYTPVEVTSKYDNPICVFALSKKDADRFEKDDYYLPYDENTKLKPMSEAAYIYITPVFSFKVLGKTYDSGTQLREIYPTLSPEQRLQFILDLYSGISEDDKYDAKEIFDTVFSKKTFNQFQEEVNEYSN